jgi:hypothetical protein
VPEEDLAEDLKTKDGLPAGVGFADGAEHDLTDGEAFPAAYE